MGFITKILGWIKSLFGFGKKPQPVAVKPVAAPLTGAALAEALNKQTAPLSGAALAEELNKQSPASVATAKKTKKAVAKKAKKA